jgi:PleD family two-component response regulator
MDPATILLAGTTYAAALVGRKAANEVVEAFWARAKQGLTRALGREPKAGDLSSGTIESLKANPEIEAELDNLLGASPVLRRAKAVERALHHSRVLWIDDHPEGNSWEHACLVALGCRVKTVESTRSALACLRTEPYDLILSDIARNEGRRAGLDVLPMLRETAPSVPVVFYVTELQGGVPDGAFGITNRPDELLHLCMDAFERKRM